MRGKATGAVTLYDPASTAPQGSGRTGRRSKEVQSTLVLGHLKMAKKKKKMAKNEANFK